MELKTTLNEEMTKRYETVKQQTGIMDDKNVLAFLISKEYTRIQRSQRHKVFLPNETYDRAEKAATVLNLTIDEYIDSVTEQLLKNPNEGLKHGEN